MRTCGRTSSPGAACAWASSTPYRSTTASGHRSPTTTGPSPMPNAPRTGAAIRTRRSRTASRSSTSSPPTSRCSRHDRPPPRHQRRDPDRRPRPPPATGAREPGPADARPRPLRGRRRRRRVHGRHGRRLREPGVGAAAPRSLDGQRRNLGRQEPGTLRRPRPDRGVPRRRRRRRPRPSRPAPARPRRAPERDRRRARAYHLVARPRGHRGDAVRDRHRVLPVRLPVLQRRAVPRLHGLLGRPFLVQAFAAHAGRHLRHPPALRVRGHRARLPAVGRRAQGLLPGRGTELYEPADHLRPVLCALRAAGPVPARLLARPPSRYRRGGDVLSGRRRRASLAAGRAGAGLASRARPSAGGGAGGGSWGRRRALPPPRPVPMDVRRLQAQGHRRRRRRGTARRSGNVTTAIVSGALANKPGNGGNAWSRLSWVGGLRALGFDVVFVEQIESRYCGTANVGWFETVTTAYGLGGSSALVVGDWEDGAGMG